MPWPRPGGQLRAGNRRAGTGHVSCGRTFSGFSIAVLARRVGIWVPPVPCPSRQSVARDKAWRTTPGVSFGIGGVSHHAVMESIGTHTVARPRRVATTIGRADFRIRGSVDPRTRVMMKQISS